MQIETMMEAMMDTKNPEQHMGETFHSYELQLAWTETRVRNMCQCWVNYIILWKIWLGLGKWCDIQCHEVMFKLALALLDLGKITYQICAWSFFQAKILSNYALGRGQIRHQTENGTIRKSRDEHN